ncbi:MAG TPA: pitrilysin family protein [Candidatus Binataceae bacterium]|jgi:predicted Zn-dependent peptidase|nr:pitrilysin family protein [Candidatus Binataceae bacterium]
MIRKSVLPNGLRVLSEPMPSVVSTTLGIWVENGSRYEVAAENGVSHFIEHLLFKGTRTRTAAQIAEEIDAVGGVLNAFTGKEYTCYYAKVLGEDLAMATELLADLFLDSVFDPAEIDRERQVVLQEISQAEDTPDDFIHDLFNLKFWEGHPLALPIFGSVATVNAINRELLLSFMAERYRAGRVFIAAAGMVDHERLVEQCARLFGGITGDGRPEPTSPPAERMVVINHHKDLEQTHLCIGGPGISQASPLRYASYVLNTALGGGMSSRLFQEVRERRGRVYSIYSFMSSYLDCGYFAIYAGTNPEWIDEVIEVTLSEIGKLVRDGLSRAELERAKSQLKGNMLLGMESTESRMNRLARNEIYFGREVPIEELARGIDQVTNDQLVELAARSFEPGRMAMVLLGDLKGRQFGADVFSALK